MNHRLYIFLISVAIILGACTSKDNISGKVEGIWETDWDDYLDGDLDDLTVNEVIAFDEDGTFQQIFSGSVKYDDWENDTKVKYVVGTGGKWHIVKPDKIVLNYDINQFVFEIGDVYLKGDYTDAAIGLITGDWGDVVSGLLSASNTTQINKKVKDAINEQLPKYFKDMFRKINKDKKAFYNVEISSGTLSATVNRGGFFGDDAIYDKKSESISHNTSQKQNKSETSGDTDDWIVEFEGSIGKYPVKMFLNIKDINDFDECEIEGSYCYTSSGSGDFISLYGVKRGETLELSEYNEEGEMTGSFDGRLDIFGNFSSMEYVGTFTNYAGKTFDFTLSYN